jgi:capsular polysaccharide biosynthesis protein
MNGFSKRIYISREKANRRRILNEEELNPILKKFGFQRIFAEDLSLFEVAGIMRDATHIVAPHGAGLSNVVFCNPGTKVMEVFNTHISTEFWKLCAARELPYFVLRAHHVTGGAIGEDELLEMSFKERNGADMILMPSDLESALDTFTGT